MYECPEDRNGEGRPHSHWRRATRRLAAAARQQPAERGATRAVAAEALLLEATRVKARVQAANAARPRCWPRAEASALVVHVLKAPAGGAPSILAGRTPLPCRARKALAEGLLGGAGLAICVAPAASQAAPWPSRGPATAEALLLGSKNA